MRERYPRFRRAQIERGPYYSGPPFPRPRDRFVLLLVAALLIGAIAGTAIFSATG